MLDKLLEILIGLLVASGSAGVAIAQDAAPADPQVPSSVIEKLAWARSHAAEVRRDAVVDGALEATSQAANDGLVAADAIENATELAPDAADQGLQRAGQAIGSGGRSVAEEAPDDISPSERISLGN